MKNKKKTTSRYPSSSKRTNHTARKSFIPFAICGLVLVILLGILLSNVFKKEHFANEISTEFVPDEHLLEIASEYNYRLDEIYIQKITKEFHDIDGEGLQEHLILYMNPHGNRLALNTREFNLSRANGDISEFGEFEFVSLSEKDKEIIQKAKEHVINYIKSSSILENKEFLIESVSNLPFYKYSKVEHDVDGLMYTSIATYIDNAVYLNQKTDEQFCVYVATHELLHYICDLTNTDSRFYSSTNFEEAMTDALTNAINPCYSEDPSFHYGYSNLFDILYLYLNVFGEDAIYAYFYGYDKFFEKYGTTNFILEHDAFVSAMLGFLEDPYLCIDLTTQIIEKWRRDFE